MSKPTDPWPAMTTSMRSPSCNSSWSVRRCSNCSEAGWCLNSRIFSPAPTTQQSGAWTHRWSQVSLRYKLNLKLFTKRSENTHEKRQIPMSQSQLAFVIFRLNFKTNPRYLLRKGLKMLQIHLCGCLTGLEWQKFHSYLNLFSLGH